MPGHNLFFALQPDEATAERFARVVTQEHETRGLKPRLRPSRIFHVTLHFFGRFPDRPDPQLVKLAMQAAAEVDWPAFDLCFDRFESWGHENAKKFPFVLTGGQGLEPVRELQAELARRLVAQGLQVQGEFNPHLTLRYDKRRAPAWELDLPGWVASEFVLIDSPQGETRHDVIARWPLQG